MITGKNDKSNDKKCKKIMLTENENKNFRKLFKKI